MFATVSTRRTGSIARPAAILLVALATWIIGPDLARADNIDAELLRQSSKIFKHLKEKGYQNVGVLKFQVQKGDKQPSFHVGPLNSNMAIRLEDALILANDSKKPLNIIHDAASLAAHKKDRLSIRTAAGHQKLFDLKYPLAWGSDKVSPDAFLTGLVQIDQRSRKATVTIEAMDKTSNKLEKILEFKTAIDRSILSDAGQGFVLAKRSLKKSASDQDQEANDDSKDREEKKKEDVNKSKDKPVEVKIFVDDNEAAIQSDPSNPGDERFTMADPKAGNKVHITLRNVTDKKVGVVLMVNGVNTIDQETEQADKCTKWILDPGQEYKIEGFYDSSKDTENLSRFNVLSDEDSDKEDFANEAMGRIQIHAFVEGGDAPSTDGDKNVSLRGIWSKKRTDLAKRGFIKTAAAAKMALMKATGKRSKGLIKPGGDVGDNKLNRVDFKNPTESMHMIIKYYEKKASSSETAQK